MARRASASGSQRPLIGRACCRQRPRPSRRSGSGRSSPPCGRRTPQAEPVVDDARGAPADARRPAHLDVGRAGDAPAQSHCPVERRQAEPREHRRRLRRSRGRRPAGRSLFPAWSVQLPVSAVAAGSSGRRSRPRCRRRSPRGRQTPTSCTASGWLYQPSWSGGRAGAAAMPVGGVASNRKREGDGGRGIARLVGAAAARLNARRVRARVGVGAAGRDPGDRVGAAPVDARAGGCTSRPRRAAATEPPCARGRRVVAERERGGRGGVAGVVGAVADRARVAVVGAAVASAARCTSRCRRWRRCRSS